MGWIGGEQQEFDFLVEYLNQKIKIEPCHGENWTPISGDILLHHKGIRDCLRLALDLSFDLNGFYAVAERFLKPEVRRAYNELLEQSNRATARESGSNEF